MRNKVLLIIMILIIILGLIILIPLFLVNSFFEGTPWEKYSARIKTQEYLRKKYPDKRFKITNINKWLKDNLYNVQVKVHNDSKHAFCFDVRVYNDGIIHDFYIENYICKDLREKIFKNLKKKNNLRLQWEDVIVFAREIENYGIDSSNYKTINIQSQNIPVSISIITHGEKISKQEYIKKVIPIYKEILNLEYKIDQINLAYQIERNKNLYNLQLVDGEIFVSDEDLIDHLRSWVDE